MMGEQTSLRPNCSVDATQFIPPRRWQGILSRPPNFGKTPPPDKIGGDEAKRPAEAKPTCSNQQSGFCKRLSVGGQSPPRPLPLTIRRPVGLACGAGGAKGEGGFGRRRRYARTITSTMWHFCPAIVRVSPSLVHFELSWRMSRAPASSMDESSLPVPSPFPTTTVPGLTKYKKSLPPSSSHRHPKSLAARARIRNTRGDSFILSHLLSLWRGRW
ncbi:MAG: hypothetical protein CEN88_377 [Candidatus Berkelbacteria bacterium Licking1014_2]|uniref:Uncharacterized protein n=1 Tax=Candidatus Berkelbacteria bacterium Licking1014_2 TaxID=2017146 RepID=A0A554LUD2_9BACT|nr:MAG: hypothetical protein CEN88_377 [Candidatus Berkelbacteria bacterium Licking1014_2]